MSACAHAVASGAAREGARSCRRYRWPSTAANPQTPFFAPLPCPLTLPSCALDRRGLVSMEGLLLPTHPSSIFFVVVVRIKGSNTSGLFDCRPLSSVVCVCGCVCVCSCKAD